MNAEKQKKFTWIAGTLLVLAALIFLTVRYLQDEKTGIARQQVKRPTPVEVAEQERGTLYLAEGSLLERRGIQLEAAL